MKSNSLTLSQAHKIYTGKGMGMFAMWLSLAGVLMFFGTIVLLLIMGLISERNLKDALNVLNGSPVPNVFLAMDAGILLMIFGLMNYEKHLPGGKYFRTVKGGFDTYRKMKYASLITRVAALIVIMVFGALADISGLMKLVHGTTDVLYIGAFLLISIGLINLMNLIRNPVVRGLSTPFIIFAAGLLGVILPNILDGKIYFALAVAVIAVPIIMISQKVMLNDYKKRKWSK